MFPLELLNRVEPLLDRYRSAGLRLATVESCTGGLLCGLLTSVAGSSDVIERGFVTYSNAAKSDLVGVPDGLIAAQGAVSAEVAEAMAAGALSAAPIDVAVSITGIAGPGGATPGKPVGLVYLGLARRGGAPRHRREMFPGDRQAVRLASVVRAVDLLDEAAR